MYWYHYKMCVITFDTDLTWDDVCSTCRTEEETDLNLGTSFSAETNRRDEDADMYVWFLMIFWFMSDILTHTDTPSLS